MALRADVVSVRRLFTVINAYLTSFAVSTLLEFVYTSGRI